MDIRHRVTMAMVSTLAVAALLVPGVSEAAPARPPARPLPVPYYVHLDSFHISHTRSPHTDTDTVHLRAGATGQGSAAVTWGPQDVRNGDHSVGLVLGPYYLTPDNSASLAFGYYIWNGYGEAMGKINTKCDGPVVAVPYAWPYLDTYPYVTVTFSGAQLWNLTASGSYSETRNYPGTNSPWGCGPNSNYDVTWHISRGSDPYRSL